MLCVLRRLSEKFRTKNKKLFFVFVDLENAFDQVPREVVRFALRWKGVPEYLVNVVMSLYKGCKTAVSADGKLSSPFSLKVGVHQGSDVPRQVSVVSCCDFFVCRTCLGNNCSLEEKLGFKRGEDILEEVEKFCYLGDVISYYGGASEPVSTWKKFRELSV